MGLSAFDDRMWRTRPSITELAFLVCGVLIVLVGWVADFLGLFEIASQPTGHGSSPHGRWRYGPSRSCTRWNPSGPSRTWSNSSRSWSSYRSFTRTGRPGRNRCRSLRRRTDEALDLGRDFLCDESIFLLLPRRRI